MRFNGVSSENSITPSTNNKDDKIIALVSWLLIGLFGPFVNQYGELSELTPTIKISPKSRDFDKYSTCPRCNISKQPFVKTIFLFSDFHTEICSWILFQL